MREKQLLEKEKELQKVQKHELELEDENSELRKMVEAFRAQMKRKDAN